MSLQVLLFLGSLVLVLGASELLSRGLDRLGSRVRLSDEVLGLLTALGVGIVLGSNLFNLAALLGLGALIAGEVAAPVAGNLLNGVAAVAVTLVAGCLVDGILTPVVSGFLLLIIVLPYLYVVVSGRSNLEFLPLPAGWKRFLAVAGGDARLDSANIGQQNREPHKDDAPDRGSEKSWSIGLVKSSSAIASGWLPPAVLGTFVLDSLTGSPNWLTAVRLARKDRGGRGHHGNLQQQRHQHYGGPHASGADPGSGAAQPLIGSRYLLAYFYHRARSRSYREFGQANGGAGSRADRLLCGLRRNMGVFLQAAMIVSVRQV